MAEKSKTIFITGAAGYVGGMLCDQFSRREDVAKIIGLDVEERPDLLKRNEKIIWFCANTADREWEGEVANYNPDVVIHTAWHIREMYGKRKEQWRWNVEGSNHVFSFAFQTPSVKKLIHFSSAAVYGAYKTNSLQYRFTENDPIREEEYSYGQEKKHVDEILHERFCRDGKGKKVVVIRPAAITGPRGRFARIRFGLQSALSGQLKKDFLYNIISLWVSFVPATPWWVRQFVHEDDMCDIVARHAFEDHGESYEIYNAAPPGKPVFAYDMARAVGKSVVIVSPWMVRLAYFVMWHLTRGKIPVARGVWRFYSYPVLMDGSKLTRVCGYQYMCNSLDAFQYTVGRYEYCVPKNQLNHKARPRR